MPVSAAESINTHTLPIATQLSMACGHVLRTNINTFFFSQFRNYVVMHLASIA